MVDVLIYVAPNKKKFRKKIITLEKLKKIPKILTFKDLFDRSHIPLHSTSYVSRCFENKNNNSCEKKTFFINYELQIPNLATLLPGRPKCRVARNGFVNNKQIAIFKKKNSQHLLFLFSKHLDTMSNVTDCVSSQTDICNKNKIKKAYLMIG